MLDPKTYFPETLCCSFANGTTAPLVVTPKDANMNFSIWARSNQARISQAIKAFGAIVFSGFGLQANQFGEAFTAATGLEPAKYKGDTPRGEVYQNIYHSTAVSGHRIPLHQECSVADRRDMPKYISFFCEVAPNHGTGQTRVGNARVISEKIQRLMPELWQKLTTKRLTYIARYLPDNSWRTRWIRWLNPSHATISQRFGTTDRNRILEKCAEEGLKCEWDGDWVVLYREGLSGTIDIDGKKVYCNQIHVDKLSPKLCGGWINYIFARLLLYPTQRSLQFDVKFEDNTEINIKDTVRLLEILEEHEEGRDWKSGDLMIYDNASTMHAKTAHVGQRQILVAMAGSVVQS